MAFSQSGFTVTGNSVLAPGGVLPLVNHYFFAIDSASRMTRHIHNSFRWSPGLNQVAAYRRTC
jgi:hypothetical protein